MITNPVQRGRVKQQQLLSIHLKKQCRTLTEFMLSIVEALSVTLFLFHYQSRFVHRNLELEFL